MRTLIQYALAFVGKPYLWGATGPEGYDCSGFVYRILQFGGVEGLQRLTAQAFHDFLKNPERNIGTSAQPGAIAFYGPSEGRIDHVCFCVDGQRILGAIGGDQTVTDVETALKKRAFVRGEPLHYRADLVGVLMPKYEVEN